MTEPAHISLFDEMDVAGDALRKDDPNLHDALGDELQRLFRKIREQMQAWHARRPLPGSSRRSTNMHV